MRHVTRMAALFLLAAIAGCDTTPVTAPAPSPALPASETARAYLTLPAVAPVAGQAVAVRLNARRPAGSEALGSFTVRIAFDTSGLRFLASESSRDGMVLAQAANGVVTLAGASSAGFVNEEIAGVTLQVVDPAALQHLTLEIVELTTTSFHEEGARTVTDQRTYRRAVVR